MTVKVLPGVDCALTAIRKGGPENGVHGYAAIGTFAEQQGYDLSGAAREIFLVPPQPDNLNDMLVEIQYPVTTPNV